MELTITVPDEDDEAAERQRRQILRAHNRIDDLLQQSLNIKADIEDITERIRVLNQLEDAVHELQVGLVDAESSIGTNSEDLSTLWGRVVALENES